MAIKVDHELHKRRLSRNVGVGIALICFVGLVYGLTVAKVSDIYTPEPAASEANQ
ncbi:hypothetical protein [Aliiroseovarius sediminis]|uniref:hypothetical protein n=1 Tax=Aliiroseovarius sediminis TaxID=2925839 RepID=UPI001F5943AE|nr:hypothetical protein [Aliiroseovarius sediminis]MCI2394505.1 hypothetical protein [Aliiroseovarius sediminis]